MTNTSLFMTVYNVRLVPDRCTMLCQILATIYSLQLTLHLLISTSRKWTDPISHTKLGKLSCTSLDIRTAWSTESNVFEKSITNHLTWIFYIILTAYCCECSTVHFVTLTALEQTLNTVFKVSTWTKNIVRIEHANYCTITVSFNFQHLSVVDSFALILRIKSFGIDLESFEYLF